MTNEVESEVERYCAEVARIAPLSRGDLDEIGDHFRSIATELVSTGRSSDDAVVEARRRLGDPIDVAREYERASSPFGARLSRSRAWSAALLLAPIAIVAALDLVRQGPRASLASLELVLGIGLLLLLVLRLSWARMFVLGSVASSIVWMGAWMVVYSPRTFALRAACYLGAAAFLFPWRRREVSAAGLALASMGPAYTAASMFAALRITEPGGVERLPWLGVAAIALVLLGGAGALLRSRWAAAASVGAAALLGWGALRTAALNPKLNHPEAFRAMVLTTLIVGAAFALVSAALTLRVSRRFAGTLRGLRS